MPIRTVDSGPLGMGSALKLDSVKRIDSAGVVESESSASTLVVGLTPSLLTPRAERRAARSICWRSAGGAIYGIWPKLANFVSASIIIAFVCIRSSTCLKIQLAV